ncbi:hypothetical protein [Nostoc sp. C117]|uniref:hypothetical protein n=1 Tax=Nostoc sp. C117 TaxID=3349875 RepID=UPI00370DE15C
MLVQAIASIHQALKPGGRFVAEFGGTGNLKAIATALSSALEAINTPTQALNPWYFTSIGKSRYYNSKALMLSIASNLLVQLL